MITRMRDISSRYIARSAMLFFLLLCLSHIFRISSFYCIVSSFLLGLWMIDLMVDVEMDTGFVAVVYEWFYLCHISFYVYIVNYDVLLFSGYPRLQILFGIPF